jgi:hypothetical protein
MCALSRVIPHQQQGRGQLPEKTAKRVKKYVDKRVCSNIRVVLIYVPFKTNRHQHADDSWQKRDETDEWTDLRP